MSSQTSMWSDNWRERLAALTALCEEIKKERQALGLAKPNWKYSRDRRVVLRKGAEAA